MTRKSMLLALAALLALPSFALAQEPEQAEIAPTGIETLPRLREPMRPMAQPRLVPRLAAPLAEPIAPAGDSNAIAPAQAIEPTEDDPFGDDALGDDAFPEDPAADEALQQAFDDGFGDALGGQALAADEVQAEEVQAAAAGEATDPGPGASQAEEYEEAHPPPFAALILNFLIWGAIVVLLLRKPLTSFLKNRRVAVIEGLEESRRIKEEAEAKHAEYTQRLAHLDEELAKLRQEMLQAGEAERDRIIAEAEARAARMRRDAQFVVDQQMKQLKADLTREAIEAAVKAAEEVLTAQTSAADQERLAKAYLGDVASSMRDEGPKTGEVQA